MSEEEPRPKKHEWFHSANDRVVEDQKKWRKHFEEWSEEELAKLENQETLKYCLKCGQEFHSKDPTELLCSDCEGKENAI